MPGSLELVERLDDAGGPLFAITNFGHEFWEGFRPTQPIFDRFRDIIVSGTEKLMKPDPAIYALAIERFGIDRSEEHTSELQSLMRISYAVFCLKTKKLIELKLVAKANTTYNTSIKLIYNTNYQT